MMDGVEVENEGAINLSTSTKEPQPQRYPPAEARRSPDLTQPMQNGDPASPAMESGGEASQAPGAQQVCVRTCVCVLYCLFVVLLRPSNI